MDSRESARSCPSEPLHGDARTTAAHRGRGRTAVECDFQLGRVDVVRVEEARDVATRQAVYAFRYTVYVEEMGRRQAHADHTRRLLAEPEDESARLLVARNSHGEVVGTARVHLAEHIPPSLQALYQLHRFAPFHPRESSTTTKLMVDRRYRRSPLALRLAQACYDIGLSAGVSFNFIDCNAHLRPFFFQLGFRQVLPDFDHRDYGVVSPLVLALRDVEYLRRIRSPFVVPDMAAGHPSVAFLERMLAPTLPQTGVA